MWIHVCIRSRVGYLPTHDLPLPLLTCSPTYPPLQCYKKRGAFTTTRSLAIHPTYRPSSGRKIGGWLGCGIRWLESVLLGWAEQADTDRASLPLGGSRSGWSGCPGRRVVVRQLFDGAAGAGWVDYVTLGVDVSVGRFGRERAHVCLVLRRRKDTVSSW